MFRRTRAARICCIRLVCAAVVLLGVAIGTAGGSPGGALDPRFGSGGRALVDLGGTDLIGMAVQSDGRVVIPGWVESGVERAIFAVVRLNADGSIDRGFGGDGRVEVDLGSPLARAFAVALQSDGAIVVGGWATNAQGRSDFALVRLLPNGGLDSSFGSGGIVLTDFRGGSEALFALLIEPDGKIVAAGGSNVSRGLANYDFAVARYSPDGTLDPSFNGDGRVVTEFEGGDFVYAIARHDDGRLLAAGGTSVEEYSRGNTALARYNADGSLDSTFDEDGRVVTDFAPGRGDAARGLAIQADGGAILVSAGVGLTRYRADGSVDTSFGHGGVASGPGGDVVLQRNGKIVAAGGSLNGDQSDFALARFLPNGRPDRAFGRGGVVATDLGGDEFAAALALEQNGRILATGPANRGAHVAVARYMPGTCSSPRLRGRTLASARARLVAGNCRLGTVRTAFSRRVKKRRVISQTPRAGLELADWARVNLVVSKGRRR